MTDPETPTTERPASAPHSIRTSNRSGLFRGALIGAALAFFVGMITDPKTQTTERPASASQPIRASNSSGSFRGAFLGAALAFLFGMLTNFYSNYLTRRDQHVQEADKCNSLVSSLLTTTSFARDVAQAAASSIAAPVPANSNGKKFVLPPIDEIIHSLDQYLDIIDPDSRNIVLQLEAYYRAIRDDLSNTADVFHTGETFELLATSPNKGFYETILHQIAQEAEAATHSLESSPHCDDLAKAELFWPRVRQHPRASGQ